MVTKQTGLTLIEIMIAVAILAILSAIAVPLYQGYVVEARYGTALKDIRQMQLILDDLALDNSLAAIEPAGYSAGDNVNVYTNDSGIQVAAATPAGTQPWLDPWMGTSTPPGSSTSPLQSLSNPSHFSELTSIAMSLRASINCCGSLAW